jgi:hypothetical protein
MEGAGDRPPPRPQMRGLSVVTLLLAALVASACGGERLSKHAYEQRVRTTYAGVQEAFRATDVASTARLPQLIGRAQGSLRAAADRLEQSEPPKEVEEQNEEIAEGLREYADDLEALKEAARRGDREAIDRFNSGLSDNRALKRVAEAAEEMKEKRYDLGPIAEE